MNAVADILNFDNLPEVISTKPVKAWSPYQVAIFDWVRKHAKSVGHRVALIIRAVAGSGKTTTVVEAADLIPAMARAVFLAFNKTIADELGARLPRTVESRTLNSLGNGAVRKALGNVQLDAGKVRKIIDKLTFGDRSVTYTMKRDAAQLVSKAKAHGYVVSDARAVSLRGEVFTVTGEVLTGELWTQLADHYSIDIDSEDKLITLAHTALRMSLEDTKTIDWDDQVYLVAAYDLSCDQYDWMIVDEGQDVSHVQRKLIDKFLARDGRLIVVGDDKQAIYGFRGADSKALQSIKEMFKADELPLSVTYRCAKSIVRAAQVYNPDLQAREDAPEGSIDDAREWNAKNFKADDLIICRYTAPIISTAYKLFAAGVPCRVKGRDIGEGLVTLVQKVCGFVKAENTSVDTLQVGLERWRAKELVKAGKKDDERLIDSINDRANSVLAVIENSEAQNAQEVIDEIKKLFDPENGGVTLSSVHRAKGLEADRVIILNRECMPSNRATQPWQIEQEEHLIYVALTRAKTQLINVNADTIFI